MQRDPSKRGQPTKFTDSCKAKLIEALKKGATYELACNYARVSYVTFRKWMIKGEEGQDQSYVDFLNDIKGVEGEASLRWLDAIDSAMDLGAWQAAAWKLERRHPDSYSANAFLQKLSEQMKQLGEQMKGDRNVAIESKDTE